MDGILSGFRFSNRKTSADSKKGPEQQPVPQALKTQQTQPQEAVKQDSVDHPTHDRSHDMRLSKNTPGKADEDFEIPADPVMPSTFSSTPAPVSARPVSSGFHAPATIPAAVIGPKISFKGELTGEEDLLIQGRVEGTIDLKGNHLTIGQQGVVKANLMAKTITIEGTVEGDLIGQERIEIKSSSNVKGNLIAARVTLEDGAKFRGSIDMDSQSNGGSGKYSYSTSAKTESKTE